MFLRIPSTYISIACLTLVNTLGFSVLIPVLPFVVEQYGGSDIIYGLILSSYSLFQFFGSPLLGKLSDTYGRRPLLLLSQCGTLLSWGVFGLSYFVVGEFVGLHIALWIIFFARMFDGITGGNVSVANAYLADTIPAKQRSVVFGYMGAVTGIGMIVGPAMGGYAASFSIDYLGTIILSATISLVTLLIMYFYLPESLPVADRTNVKWSVLIKRLQPWVLWQESVNSQTLKYISMMRIGFAMAMSSYISIIILYMIDTFGFAEREIGFFLLFVGLFLIFNQAVLVKVFIRWFGDLRTLILGQACMLFGFLTIGFVEKLWLFVICYYLLNLGLSLSFPLFKSLFLQHASSDAKGSILGFEESLAALVTSIMPLIAGTLYYYFASGAFVILSLSMVLSLFFGWKVLGLPSKSNVL